MPTYLPKKSSIFFIYIASLLASYNAVALPFCSAVGDAVECLSITADCEWVEVECVEDGNSRGSLGMDDTSSSLSLYLADELTLTGQGSDSGSWSDSGSSMDTDESHTLVMARPPGGGSSRRVKRNREQTQVNPTPAAPATAPATAPAAPTTSPGGMPAPESSTAGVGPMPIVIATPEQLKSMGPERLTFTKPWEKDENGNVISNPATAILTQGMPLPKPAAGTNYINIVVLSSGVVAAAPEISITSNPDELLGHPTVAQAAGGYSNVVAAGELRLIADTEYEYRAQSRYNMYYRTSPGGEPPDEEFSNLRAHAEAAVAYFRSLGINVTRIVVPEL